MDRPGMSSILTIIGDDLTHIRENGPDLFTRARPAHV
jgi:hypothetical protein